MCITNALQLHIMEPIAVKIQDVISAPVDLVVEGVLPVNQEFKIPVQADVECVVDLSRSVPVIVDVDLGPEDFVKGLCLAPTRGPG